MSAVWITTCKVLLLTSRGPALRHGQSRLLLRRKENGSDDVTKYPNPAGQTLSTDTLCRSARRPAPKDA